MGAPKWPPNPQCSERPGTAVTLLDNRSPRRYFSYLKETFRRAR